MEPMAQNQGIQCNINKFYFYIDLEGGGHYLNNGTIITTCKLICHCNQYYF